VAVAAPRAEPRRRSHSVRAPRRRPGSPFLQRSRPDSGPGHRERRAQWTGPAAAGAPPSASEPVVAPTAATPDTRLARSRRRMTGASTGAEVPSLEGMEQGTSARCWRVSPNALGSSSTPRGCSTTPRSVGNREIVDSSRGSLPATTPPSRRPICQHRCPDQDAVAARRQCPSPLQRSRTRLLSAIDRHRAPPDATWGRRA
jgi:hypothetical protein